MRQAVFAALAATVLAVSARAQDRRRANVAPPAQLAALMARARLDGPVSAWCAAGFGTGRPGGYAIAVTSGARGGRYLVLGAGKAPVLLASFRDGADLSCYSPAAARRLDRSIGKGGTIHGAIAPKWSTTVVCGFVEDTNALCWQYSPAARAFVKVGEWIT